MEPGWLNSVFWGLQLLVGGLLAVAVGLLAWAAWRMVDALTRVGEMLEKDVQPTLERVRESVDRLHGSVHDELPPLIAGMRQTVDGSAELIARVNGACDAVASVPATIAAVPGAARDAAVRAVGAVRDRFGAGSEPGLEVPALPAPDAPGAP